MATISKLVIREDGTPGWWRKDNRKGEWKPRLDEQGKPVPKSYGMDLVMVGSRDEILDAIPVAQLKPTKNWAEMEKALAAR